MPKLATWNVNSIRARLPRVIDWLDEAGPDIVLLQEIKTVAETFPTSEIEDRGYNVAICGQKTYNGVALLSKSPIEDVVLGLPGDPGDEQARYIEAFTGGVRVGSVYLPNGNPAPSAKFDYKLAWMERLYDHIKGLMAFDEAFVIGGDFNVCPTDDDVYDPPGWADDALCRPETRKCFRALMHLGLTDAIRVHQPGAGVYTYWDYTGGAWQKDFGLRIDHLLLSPHAADRLADAGIDSKTRGRQKPSDHVPVWCELAGAALPPT